MHSSPMVSAQNWMRCPGDGVAWTQTPPPPAEPGEVCARLRRRSTLSRHCIWALGEAASPGGLRSNSLAATSGPFGAGTDWATEARSAARCGAARAATLDVGRREACGIVDATSSPNWRS
jgi:hypothetical protein